MDAPAISARGLTKRYGSLVAVDALSFDVPRRAVFGFLGPNGSGKTTTLGMITGLVAPDAGTALVDGHDVREDLAGALRSVGALIEEPAFYPYLSGARNLALLARLRGAPREAASRALAMVGLASVAERKYAGYSTGMRRRLGMAAAMLGEPPVVMLDEPTNGLDPQGQIEARQLFRDLAARGQTLVVSSHLLHEVQETCTHVAIVHKGKLLAVGEMRDVLKGSTRLEIVVDDVDRARRVVEAQPGVGAIEAREGKLLVDTDAARAAAINRALVERGVAVSALIPRAPELERLFLDLTSEASP